MAMERFTTYECITVKAINLMLWMITAALPVAEATLGPLQASASQQAAADRGRHLWK